MNTYYFSFKVNKKKIKGKVEAENHRSAWLKVLSAVDTLEKLGGLSVTDVNIPPQPQNPTGGVIKEYYIPSEMLTALK